MDCKRRLLVGGRVLIGFNAQRLAGQRFGVGRYVEYMIRYWGEMLTADEAMTVYLRKPLAHDEAAALNMPSNVRTVVTPSHRSGIPWENWHLRRMSRNADVLFCPAYSAPIGYRRPLVVATHSVNEIQDGTHAWWYTHTYGRLYRHSARIADAVIVPSTGTRDQVAERYRVPLERMVIVEQGADDAFQPVVDPAQLAATRTQFFGADRPYILFVGKCSERRNVLGLIRAFAALRRDRNIPHGLVLFGPNLHHLPITELARELGVANDVVQTDGHVASHRDLVPVYGAADLFVHPSEFEGWSMTTIEAMACGTPVIAADRGGLGEVARGHAFMLADPSVDAITDAMRQVLESPTLQADLRRRALARAAGLRWSVATRQTLAVVRDVGRGHFSPSGSAT